MSDEEVPEIYDTESDIREEVARNKRDTKKTLHYCGHPDSRREPTLCGVERDGTVDTTTRAADVTCTDCEDILEGRKP